MGCSCTGGLMLVRGVPSCATCNAPVALQPTATTVEVSSVRLPADVKDADAFNRACRMGRVAGARKVGRIWVAPAEGWAGRQPAGAPKGLATKKTTSRRSTPTRTADDAVLAELGLGTRAH